MKPGVTVITLGVDDLEQSLRFYRDGLGLATEGIIGQEFEHGAVVFIDLQPGLRLALWPRASLAHDTGLTLYPKSPTEFTLGHNVNSRAEVDAVMRQATAAGAVVVKPARDTIASDDWHAARSTVDLREGGRFSARMEVKDGSEGFDIAGTYTRIVPQKLIGRRAVTSAAARGGKGSLAGKSLG